MHQKIVLYWKNGVELWSLIHPIYGDYLRNSASYSYGG